MRDSIGAASGGRKPPDEAPQLEEQTESSGLTPPLAQDLLFLKPFFLAELGVARSVKTLASGPHPLPNVNVDAAIAWAEGKMNIAFAESQRAAIRSAVTNKLMVITGGPGTGKTTIVAPSSRCLKRSGFACCSPRRPGALQTPHGIDRPRSEDDSPLAGV